MESAPPEAGPLAGIVVADFSRVLAGPYCSMILGDLGATVVKIESPSGDETRSWSPPERQGRSTYFLSVNRNKRSIALDLTQDRDRDIALRVVDASDALIENMMPGRMARFGLGYEEVHRRNPALVYASISGFGDGPGAHLPGYDLLVQAMSGFMDLTGPADGPAYRAGFALFDVLAGLHLGMAMLAAVRAAALSGEGQHIATDLLSVAMSTMVNQTGAAVLADAHPTRLGNAHPSIVPYEPLAAADREIVVAVGNDRQFARLCAVIGTETLIADPRSATASARTLHRAFVRDEIQRALRTRTAAEWLEELQRAGVPAGLVNDLRGGIELARRLGLEPVVEVEGEPTVRNPVRMSATPVAYRRRPPDLGADRDEILRWLDGVG